MKNSILTLLAVGALMSCEKKETTNVNNDADSTAVSSDTAMNATPTDSTAATATTANATSATLNDQDKKFADKAAMSGMAEVMLGELASTNGTNASVKTLGAMMVKDHTKANDELKSWASTAGYTLPTSVSAEQQKTYDDLKAKKGADFDRAFADVMVTDHKKAIEEFKKESSSGGDASLKSFAGKTLPALEHHLMESEKTKAAVK
ncbi:DUF4142 domain-containing protein [Chryseobacterium fluminis]|uniref:DUF4142 domain-containing protein n=1 Tax=Chryseobacterium fluminis TaxID=2983606 RepID=UPI00224D8851|nr:DUF4142 domain-containing protein [Chryseobacterium sp. MMS21-Ot14]UZT99373.1 DUF4142 domain-containing protein [Chryseobacterium sp. MMS21-Ot14]